MIFRILVTSVLLFSTLVAQTQIAVVEFQGKGVSNIEASALTDRLVLELFRTGEFTVLERAMLDKILEEQKFQLSGCTDTECLVELGRLANVQEIVSGSVSRVGNTYSISARLISVETGEILRIATHDQRGEIDALLTEGMAEIAHQLGPNITASKIDTNLQDTLNIDEPVNSKDENDELANDILEERALKRTKQRKSKMQAFFDLADTTNVNKSLFVDTGFAFGQPDSPAPINLNGSINYGISNSILLGVGFAVIQGTDHGLFQASNEDGSSYSVDAEFVFMGPAIGLMFFPTSSFFIRSSFLFGLDGGLDDDNLYEVSLFQQEGKDSSLNTAFSLDLGYKFLTNNNSFSILPFVQYLALFGDGFTPTSFWLGLRVGYSK